MLEILQILLHILMKDRVYSISSFNISTRKSYHVYTLQTIDKIVLWKKINRTVSFINQSHNSHLHTHMYMYNVRLNNLQTSH